MLIHGDRVGKLALLSPACGAVIFDPTRQKMLLTRRSDNGQWCLPGGNIDPGETVTECCAREVLEETGLVVSVGRLIGVYSTPHRIVEYPDGNKRQGLTLCFEAEPIGGQPGISDETTDIGYFSMYEMRLMEIWEHHVKEMVVDAFADVQPAFVR